MFFHVFFFIIIILCLPSSFLIPLDSSSSRLFCRHTSKHVLFSSDVVVYTFDIQFLINTLVVNTAEFSSVGDKPSKTAMYVFLFIYVFFIFCVCEKKFRIPVISV